jgi:hypothetical protein
MKYRLSQRVRSRKYLKHAPVILSLLIGLIAGLSISHILSSRTIPLIGLRVDGILHTSSSHTTHVSKHLVRSSSVVPPPTATTAADPSVTSQDQDQVQLQDLACGTLPPELDSLAKAVSPELRKLAQYEQLCGGSLTTHTSFFVPTPSTVTAAQGDAGYVASMLREYSNNGISPLVFMEPDTDAGTDLDLVQYKSGMYNAALSAYFSDLKADGITDSMMGTWVLIPEGNIPGWGSVDPTVFAADVSITAQFQKQYFPNSQSAILLDSETYPSASSWSDGSYSSLVPYVTGIPKGLINSFGLEGFPWASPANQSGADEYDPSIYLRTDLAAQAAQALGVNSIWLNTGTFHQMYTQDSAETVTMSPLERQTILAGVVAQAESLNHQGFNVAVHLFAQNKANTSEAIDWSYWQGKPGDEPDSGVLTTFVHNLNQAGIPLWLFDTYDQ